MSLQLKGANRHLWRITDSLDAANTAYLYDTYGMMREMAQRALLDMAELWIGLVEAGALTINHRKLTEMARRHGVDPEKYLITEEEE